MENKWIIDIEATRIKISGRFWLLGVISFVLFIGSYIFLARYNLLEPLFSTNRIPFIALYLIIAFEISLFYYFYHLADFFLRPVKKLDYIDFLVDRRLYGDLQLAPLRLRVYTVTSLLLIVCIGIIAPYLEILPIPLFIFSLLNLKACKSFMGKNY